jgi:hypothetical protein
MKTNSYHSKIGQQLQMFYERDILCLTFGDYQTEGMGKPNHKFRRNLD